MAGTYGIVACLYAALHILLSFVDLLVAGLVPFRLLCLFFCLMGNQIFGQT